jgi:ribosomal protein S18 acetylase RimI-like enzyme
MALGRVYRRRYSVDAMPARTHPSNAEISLRRATLADIGAVVALETRVFDYDVISRPSFRRFVQLRTAMLMVSCEMSSIVGYVLVLFRPRSRIARLYSIAVSPERAGRGIGPTLLAAAENSARARRCSVLRLEVHERNAAAIRRYRKSGYVLTGRRLRYYTDRGDALRFEKRLSTPSTADEDSASPAGRPA